MKKITPNFENITPIFEKVLTPILEKTLLIFEKKFIQCLKKNHSNF